MQIIIQFLPNPLPGAALSGSRKVRKDYKVGGQPPALMNPRITVELLIRK